jgi:hypothetical protein
MKSVTAPGVVKRIDVETDTPRPEDCLPPGEAPEATADLSPGWVAVTERELLAYHPDRDPAVIRTPRHNVTRLTVRRAGGRRLLQYAPATLVGSIVALLVGIGMQMVGLNQFIEVPNAPGSESVATIVSTMGWAMDLLGTVLVFSGILGVLGAGSVIAFWVVSRDVVLVVERGDAETLERPTTRQSGRRAARTIGKELTDG